MADCKIYLAGPMSGIPDWNFPAFAKKAAELRAGGLEVLSPAELHTHTDQPWAFYMKAAIREMLLCNAVYALHGHSRSHGARLELNIAHTLGLPIFYEDDNPTISTIKKVLL